MSKQMQINKTRTVPKMDEVAARYEAEQFEEQMRKARQATTATLAHSTAAPAAH